MSILKIIATGIFLILYIIGMLALILSVVDCKSDFQCWEEEDEAIQKARDNDK